MQDLNDKITDGTLTADEWNQVPSELQNVIEALGITLSSGDLNQLGKAIAGYVANGNFYIDSGAANAYVLTRVGSRQASPAYTDGFEIAFVAANTNNAASTANIDGLGSKDLRTADGSVLPSGILTTAAQGLENRFRFNLSANHFRQQTSIDANRNLDNLTSAGNAKVSTAWVSFDGTGTVAINDSFNVSSITDNAAGDYDVNFSSALANTNYSFTTQIESLAGDNTTDSMSFISNGSIATGSLGVITGDGNSNLKVDMPTVCVHVFGGT